METHELKLQKVTRHNTGLYTLYVNKRKEYRGATPELCAIDVDYIGSALNVEDLVLSNN